MSVSLLRLENTFSRGSTQVLRLYLRTAFKACDAENIDVLPKSRKACALLALIALSETRSISRIRAATLLWSSLERRRSLTRLRDTLYHLQREFNSVGLEPLRLDHRSIAFKTETIWIDLDHIAREDMPRVGSDEEFLIELDGIDPALDGWLKRIREERFFQSNASEFCDVRILPTRVQSRSKAGPSIAIVEFEPTGPRTDRQIARALTEEVGSALARLRWLSTVTRNTKGQHLSISNDDLSKIADYVLVGNLQADGLQYRLSIKVMDLKNSNIIVWVDSFKQILSAGFEFQEDIAAAVAARLDTELLFIEANKWQPPSLLQKDNAYTSVLRAIPAIYRLERESFLGAGNILEDAVEADRDSALAQSWLAYWHLFLIGQGWASNPSQSMTQAGKAADKAMMLDPKDARAFTIAGHVKAYLNRQLDKATALHELALQINPALALGWHLFGVTHAYAGRHDEAYRCILRCRELAPNDPHGFFAEGALGIVHLLRSEYEAAADVGRRVTERHPHFTSAYKSYLSALGHLGRKVEAAGVLQRLKRLDSRFTLQSFRATAPYGRRQDLEHFISGLRLAGLV